MLSNLPQLGEATCILTQGAFWQRYQRYLLNQGVKPKLLHWYKRWAQKYIDNTKAPLRNHSAEVVHAWHQQLCQQPHLADWQVLQAIDAVWHLLCFSKSPGSSGVDWQALKDASRRLANNHPTLARQATLSADLSEWERRLIGEIRRRGYAYRTEQAYLHWLDRLCRHAKQDSPDKLGTAEVRDFLEALVVQRNVAASTQNQALNACAFYYKQALDRPLDLGPFSHSKRPKRLPVVLSVQEVHHLLSEMSGTPGLIASLLYGTGMRLMECLRLRIQDLDFDYRQITVRQGKGGKDRVVPFPAPLMDPIRAHLKQVRDLYHRDIDNGHGSVLLPNALARKYPNADKEWRWQLVIPSARLSADPRDGTIRRHHLHETSVQRALKRAATRAGIDKHAHCHTLNRLLKTVPILPCFHQTEGIDGHCCELS